MTPCLLDISLIEKDEADKMIFLGLSVLIFSALFIWRGYASYLKQCKMSLCSFYDALCDMKDKMSLYLLSPREWAEKYDGRLLSDCGFTDKLCSGESVLSSYSEAKRHLHIDDDSDEVLTSLFSHFGEGYLENELAAMQSAILKLEKIKEKTDAETDKRIKVAGVLIGAILSCGVLLFL